MRKVELGLDGLMVLMHALHPRVNRLQLQLHTVNFPIWYGVSMQRRNVDTHQIYAPSRKVPSALHFKALFAFLVIEPAWLTRVVRVIREKARLAISLPFLRVNQNRVIHAWKASDVNRARNSSLDRPFQPTSCSRLPAPWMPHRHPPISNTEVSRPPVAQFFL